MEQLSESSKKHSDAFKKTRTEKGQFNLKINTEIHTVSNRYREQLFQILNTVLLCLETVWLHKFFSCS